MRIKVSYDCRVETQYHICHLAQGPLSISINETSDKLTLYTLGIFKPIWSQEISKNVLKLALSKLMKAWALIMGTLPY